MLLHGVASCYKDVLQGVTRCYTVSHAGIGFHRVLQVLADYTTYTARNTVNRLGHKELNLNPVVLELSIKP